MAARINRKHTRESIERIRETINTQLCVKELQDIISNKDNSPSVRVKAADILLSKTMPTLSWTDITNHDEEFNPMEAYQKLIAIFGEETIKAKMPQLASMPELKDLQ